MGGNLENMMYRELGLFSLKKQKLRVIFLFSSAPCGRVLEDAARLFLEVHSNR